MDPPSDVTPYNATLSGEQSNTYTRMLMPHADALSELSIADDDDDAAHTHEHRQLLGSQPGLELFLLL